MIHISNSDKGGMTKETKINAIIDSLPELSTDIIDLIQKIILHAESGLE